MPVAIAILAAIILATVQSSLFEWTFHRFWLHRPWLPEGCFTGHTLIHHQLCKFEDTFHVTEEEQHEGLTFQWWGGTVLIAINMIPWSLAAWGLSSAGVSLPYAAFLIAFASTVAVYYAGYEGLHFLMHKPTFAWIENSAYFKFIKQHHVIHHVQMDKNLNILIPIGDLLLGTLVLKPAADAPLKTSDQAKRIARRHSQFGKRLRAREAKAKANHRSGVSPPPSV